MLPKKVVPQINLLISAENLPSETVIRFDPDIMLFILQHIKPYLQPIIFILVIIYALLTMDNAICNYNKQSRNFTHTFQNVCYE